MKRFEVMTETRIAKTFVVDAADEDQAQIAVKLSAEALYEKLPETLYNFSTDEFQVEVGDATEVKNG